MENMSDALILGFSVLIFVIALTMCMTMFSRARATSEFVLHKSDKTNYYTYDRFVDETEVEASKERVVSLKDIVPTLYRYYKENYRIEFYDSTGSKLIIYTSQMQDDNGQSIGGIYYLDVEDEVSRHEPWTGSQASFKKNLDALISGGTFTYPNQLGQYIYTGLVNTFNGKRFREELVKTTITNDLNDTEEEEKFTIKYYILGD